MLKSLVRAFLHVLYVNRLPDSGSGGSCFPQTSLPEDFA